MKLKEFAYEVFYDEKSKKFLIVNDIVAILIIFSSIILALESVDEIYIKYYHFFLVFEIFIFSFFLVEYFLRIYGAPNKKGYVLSYLGIIDLLALVSAFLFILGELEVFVIFSLRLIRAIRILRVLKLLRFGTKEIKVIEEKDILNIQILFLTLLLSIYILGTLLYLVESNSGNIKNIPDGIVKVLFIMFSYMQKEAEASITTEIGKAIGFTSKIIGYIITGMIVAIIVTIFSRALLAEEVKAK
ncbi:MAG: ion transporter [Candidatus Aenigmatarchaeota archaeon]